MCFHNLHDVSLLFCNLEFLHFFWKRLLSNWTLLCLFAKARLEFLHFVWFRWICKYCINQNFSICKSSGINYSIYKLKKEYTNSLVNADLFYTNFTNTTFQKDRLFPRTKSRVNQGVGVFDNEIKTGFHYCFLWMVINYNNSETHSSF